ncbi:Thoeris anti-defense Tad2 family protein [Acidaminococcus intestini]|uniref:Thoeris anti-defense Tad2 family protein n=1 Tax=Acidaminococcus intestini TaxID=187327 RepID=UPI003C6D0E7C
MNFRDAWLKMFEGAAICRKAWMRSPESAWDCGKRAYVELAKIYKRGSHRARLIPVTWEMDSQGNWSSSLVCYFPHMADIDADDWEIYEEGTDDEASKG